MSSTATDRPGGETSAGFVALIECGSACGWTGHQSQGASVESCALTPGDPSPACRCPCCDSLAYPLPKERMIVGCSDANGSRVLIELEMEISQASRDSGEHYEQAEARAAELGYEEPFFSMDPGEQPHCKLITASRQ